MACKSCGGRPKAVVAARRGQGGVWSVVYPHGALRPFGDEASARAFIASRHNPDAFGLIDPDLNPVDVSS